MWSNIRIDLLCTRSAVNRALKALQEHYGAILTKCNILTTGIFFFLQEHYGAILTDEVGLGKTR